MALRRLDGIGEYELTCNEDGCRRRMQIRPRDLALSATPTPLPRLNWQTVGHPADNVHRCPVHRTDR